MPKIRYSIIGLGLLLSLSTPVAAQVSVSIGFPHVSIGINLPLYPELVPVPGYPVYYAPRVNSNFFFYDGMYWVYQDDYWYASSWYNGPWWVVEPEFVPVFILRVPVRYYRQPPSYFRSWSPYDPPRWGRHWGHEWEKRRSGWDRWDRKTAPPPAPRPDYQRQYSGDRYPRGDAQETLHRQHYRYQPRDTMIREKIKPQMERKSPPRQDNPPSRQRGPDLREQRPQPEAVQRKPESGPPRSQPLEREAPRGPGRSEGPRDDRDRDRDRDLDRDRDRDRDRGRGRD